MTASNVTKPKLVVFDVEGVVIPKNRLFFDVAKSIGRLPLLKILFYGFLYSIGLVPLKKTLTRIFRIFRGITVDAMSEALRKIPLMPEAKETFAALKAQGFKTALVSSGLPTTLVEKLANMLGADYAVGFEVAVNGNVLTGEAWGDVIERKGKLLVLKKLIEAEQIKPSECVVVADDRNNSSIFLKEAQKIGYSPDFIIRSKADVVVQGKLTKILPIINQNQKRKTLPTRDEVLREVIHGLGILIPVLAILLGVPIVAAFIVVVIALYTASESARVRGQNLPFFSAVTRLAASQSELCQFTLAPIYYGVGILLTLVLFPSHAGGAAIAIFCLGDSSASIIGGTLSRKALPFNRSKTLEGSIGGFVLAFLAGSIFITPWMALVGAGVGMLVEYLPLPINDNLLIPLVTGSALTLLLAIH